MKKLLKLEDDAAAAAAAEMDTFGKTATTIHPPICLLLHQLESADTGEKNAKSPILLQRAPQNQKCSDADTVSDDSSQQLLHFPGA
jgi:hypothetical protein